MHSQEVAGLGWRAVCSLVNPCRGLPHSTKQTEVCVLAVRDVLVCSGRQNDRKMKLITMREGLECDTKKLSCVRTVKRVL